MEACESRLIDTQNGTWFERKFTQGLTSPPGSGHPVCGEPIQLFGIVDGQAIVATSSKPLELESLLSQPVRGRERWSVRITGDYVWSALRYDGTHAVFFTRHPTKPEFFDVALKSGKVRVRYAPSAPCSATPVTPRAALWRDDAGAELLFAQACGRAALLDLATGKLLWEQEIGSAVALLSKRLNGATDVASIPNGDPVALQWIGTDGQMGARVDLPNDTRSVLRTSTGALSRVNHPPGLTLFDTTGRIAWSHLPPARSSMWVDGVVVADYGDTQWWMDSSRGEPVEMPFDGEPLGVLAGDTPLWLVAGRSLVVAFEP